MASDACAGGRGGQREQTQAGATTPEALVAWLNEAAKQALADVGVHGWIVFSLRQPDALNEVP
jgi:hypothetical protein